MKKGFKKGLIILAALTLILNVVTAVVSVSAQETEPETETYPITVCGEASMVYFTVNGEVVYCIDYNKLTPKTGMSYASVKLERDLSALDPVFININNSSAEKDEMFYKVAQQVIWSKLNAAKNYRAVTEKMLGEAGIKLFDELSTVPEGNYKVSYNTFATYDKNYQVVANASVMEIITELPAEVEEPVETEPVTEPETEPITEPEPETEPETEIVTELDTEPETELETELETEPETVPETEPETAPETVPETETTTEKPTLTQKLEVVEPETEDETVEVLGEVISKEDTTSERLEIPQTGDTKNISAFVVMAILSGIAIISISLAKKKTAK